MFRLDTPGGGGHGDPLARDPERVLADVREGAVSPEAAERDYGVVLAQRDRSWVVDEAATARRLGGHRLKRRPHVQELDAVTGKTLYRARWSRATWKRTR